jgi:23S rRNA pseudouridine1911/1915/1917 synthase
LPNEIVTGVPVQFEVDGFERLDKYLAAVMPDFSRSRLVEIIDQGKVRVDGKPRKPSFRLEPGMLIEMDEEPGNRPAHDLEPYDLPLDVRFEDEHVMVINKPRGLATHPAASLKEPTLVNALLARGQALSQGSEAFRPGIVHRLDKDTTGLIMVAKTDLAHRRLSEQIADKSAGREYLAIAIGNMEKERVTIEAAIGRDPRNPVKMTITSDGKPAVTHVRRIGRCDVGTIVACKLETGRTHQIRVHLMGIGHPVLGDPLYNTREYQNVPLQLHAWKLSFDHPISADRVEVTAAPPSDFVAEIVEEDIPSTS